MARAYIGNIPCEVTIDKDLGVNWEIAVIPPHASPIPGSMQLAPLVVKLQGEDRDRCLAGGLEILLKAGKIDRFDV